MTLPASSKVVMAAIPGTVIDIVQRTRMSERLVRLRVAELRQQGLIRVLARKKSGARGGCWAVYG